MNGNSVNNNRIKQLTGARFIAIMMVVIHHMEFLRKYGSFGSIYLKYFHNSYLAVDFFFVLSGFGMMLSNYRNHPFEADIVCGVKESFAFAFKRIKKIYPLYVLTLLIGVPYIIIVGTIDYGTGLTVLIIRVLGLFAFDLTLLQSLTGMLVFSHSLNSVCWFLSTLFCIYLVSPLIIRMIRRHIGSTKKAVICLLLCIINVSILAALFTRIESFTPFDDLTYGSPYIRVFYVMTGMLIAVIYHNIKNSINPFFIGTLETISIIIASVWILLSGQIDIFFICSLNLAIVSLVVFCLAYGYGPFSKLLSTHIMERLGKLSMFIFLVHYPIVRYIQLCVRLVPDNTLTVGIIEVLLILILTFAAAIIIDKHSIRRY